MDFALKLLVAAFTVLLSVSTADAATPFGDAISNTKVRVRAAQWNLARAIRPTNPATEGMSLVTIAGASKRQLREWMQKCPPPTIAEMHGTWRGLNRGLGPAVLGFSQFTKTICTDCRGGHGDNITIKQVSPEYWCPQNWLAKRKDHEFDRHGNYIVEPTVDRCSSRQGVILNYRAADNPLCDPARFLVDKIVKLDDRYLLGKAMYKVGLAKVTVAYFVLERAH